MNTLTRRRSTPLSDVRQRLDLDPGNPTTGQGPARPPDDDEKNGENRWLTAVPERPPVAARSTA